MKTQNIIYWATTGLVAAGMAASGLLYLSQNSAMVASFTSVGLPMYLMLLLGVAKLLGALALVAPLGSKIKEWAYAGFTFTFLGAVVTHVATGTPWVAPVIALALLGVSYVFWMRRTAI